MHYFKKNIGDYAKKAGRLTMLQHGSYTLLVDACYDREQFPTLDEAIDWTWASTKEEIEAVEFVLRKFFVVEDGLYVEKNIQADIKEYHAKAELNQRIAAQREAKRKQTSTNRARSVYEPCLDSHESPPNQETNKPINQEITTPQPPKGEIAMLPATPDGFAKFWDAWPANDRKQAKGKCLEAWRKAKAEQQSEIVVSHVSSLKSSAWMRDNGQFIPAPLVYLNQRRWEGAEPIAAQRSGVLAGAI